MTGTVITAPEQIEFYRLCVLRTALRLEILGLKRSRSPSAYSALKQMGYKGQRSAVLAQVNEDITNSPRRQHESL